MDEQELRKRAEARVNAKMAFFRNLIGYSVLVGFLALINMLTSPQYPWAIWPALGMGLPLAMQGVKVFSRHSGAMAEFKQHMIQEEMRRERGGH